MSYELRTYLLDFNAGMAGFRCLVKLAKLQGIRWESTDFHPFAVAWHKGIWAACAFVI